MNLGMYIWQILKLLPFRLSPAHSAPATISSRLLMQGCPSSRCTLRPFSPAMPRTMDGWATSVLWIGRMPSRLCIASPIVLDQSDGDKAGAQWHPGRVARIMSGDTPVGVVGELHPKVDDALGFPRHSAAFEIDLTALFSTLSNKPVQAKPISTFPPVKQDLAFTVPTSVTVRQAAGDVLESIELFDVYTGDQVGDGKKSLAYAVTFRAPDRTLTSQDSEEIRQRIVEKTATLGAQLRA